MAIFIKPRISKKSRKIFTIVPIRDQIGGINDFDPRNVRYLNF